MVHTTRLTFARILNIIEFYFDVVSGMATGKSHTAFWGRSLTVATAP